MGNYVTCAQAVADKSAQANKDAAQDAAIANAAGAGAAAVTPTAVLAQVQNMSPAQIAAMCAKLNCAPTAAALTQSLLLLAGSGVVGNVLQIDANGNPSFNDVIAEHVAGADPHVQYVKKAGDVMLGNLIGPNLYVPRRFVTTDENLDLITEPGTYLVLPGSGAQHASWPQDPNYSNAVYPYGTLSIEYATNFAYVKQTYFSANGTASSLNGQPSGRTYTRMQFGTVANTAAWQASP